MLIVSVLCLKICSSFPYSGKKILLLCHSTEFLSLVCGFLLTWAYACLQHGRPSSPYTHGLAKQILLSSQNGLCILSIALLFIPLSTNNILPSVCQTRPVPRGLAQMPRLHGTVLDDPAEEKHPDFSRPKKHEPPQVWSIKLVRELTKLKKGFKETIMDVYKMSRNRK